MHRLKRWHESREFNWERIRETANRIGITLFIAGILRWVVESANYHPFLWPGLFFIAISLWPTKKPAPSEPPEKNT